MSECSKAVEKLAKALSEYFKKRGPLAAGYIEITRQPEVKVSLRAIALHYESTEDLPYLEDALRALDSEKLFEYLEKKLRWKLTILEEEEYLSIPSDQYLRYINASYEFFKNLLEQYCSP